MGTVFKKTVTRSLPENATVKTRSRKATEKELRKYPDRKTITETIATWRDRSGKKRTGVFFESERTVQNGFGRNRQRTMPSIATATKSFRLYRPVAVTNKRHLPKLAELFKTAENVRSGVLSGRTIAEIAEHLRTALGGHLDDYRQSMQAAGITAGHIADTCRKIEILKRDCEFRLLRDVNAVSFERWLVEKQKAGLAPRTRNSYLQAIGGFLNWCVDHDRLKDNPLRKIKRTDESTDKRRKRRALDESELRRLLYVARWRPIAEFGRQTVRRDADDLPDNSNSRRTWRKEPLTYAGIADAIERGKSCLADNPDYLAELDRRGWRRSLIYKVAVLTGLRLGEIESLTVGHLDLDGSTPCVNMQPADTKNREAVTIPLRSELADDLRQWNNPKRQSFAGVVSIKLQTLPPDERLFGNVPRQLVKTLDRDLAVAGIPKTDDRGRTVDFHALRHSFGTLLSTSGVAPRTAQQAMRHSTIELTMNTYTDPRLLDVAGAIDSLPNLPIDRAGMPDESQRQQVTGTESFVAPMVAPTDAYLVQRESKQDKQTSCDDLPNKMPKQKKTPQKHFGVLKGWLRGLEPPTPGTTIQCSNQLSYSHHEKRVEIVSPFAASVNVTARHRGSQNQGPGPEPSTAT